MQGNGYIAGAAGDQADLDSVFAFDWDDIENPFSRLAQAEIDQLAETLLQNPDLARDVLALLPMRGDAQRLFRRSLLLGYRGRCAICGLSIEDALEAAHILPWCDGHPEARVDPRNGILFCANHHKLFDSGHLSITADYCIEFYDSRRSNQPYTDTDLALAVSYHQCKLHLPSDKHLHPNPLYLELRRSTKRMKC